MVLTLLLNMPNRLLILCFMVTDLKINCCPCNFHATLQPQMQWIHIRRVRHNHRPERADAPCKLLYNCTIVSWTFTNQLHCFNFHISVHIHIIICYSFITDYSTVYTCISKSLYLFTNATFITSLLALYKIRPRALNT